jgi:hypothetical protein
MIAWYKLNLGITLDSQVIYFGRSLMVQFSNVYALRMAGVFMISLGTIWLRTGLIPRWLVVLTYLLAGTLLIIINLSIWITLIFPVWVIIISVETMILKYRRLT